MNVLITGGSGFVGRNVAARLRRTGHEVRAVSRRDGCDFQRLQNLEDWLPWLVSVDAVVNCVGIISQTQGQNFTALHSRGPVALFQACAQAGVRRVIQISALGADERAAYPFHMSKRQADQALQHLDLDWLVLRPSLIYGRGGGSAECFLKLAALPVFLMPASGPYPVQAIHIRDVAQAVLAALSAPPRRCLDLVGGESYDLEDWLQRMRQAMGLNRARVLHVPRTLCLGLAHLLQFVLPLAAPDNFRMLFQGGSGDVADFQSLVGRAPLVVKSELFFQNVLDEEPTPC